MTTNVYNAVDELIDYARKNLELDPRNEDFTRNAIFAILV